MVFMYQKLPGNRRSRGGFPVKAWLVMKRAAIKVAGLCVTRRRWAVVRYANARRHTWTALWAKVKRTVCPAHARHVGASYDSVSYARNFDDGVWKEEEEEYWRSGSFAYRFGQSARLVMIS